MDYTEIKVKQNRVKAMINSLLKLNKKSYRQHDAYTNQVLKVFNRNLNTLALFDLDLDNNTVYVNDSIMWVTDQRKLMYVIPKGTKIIHKELHYEDWSYTKRLCDAPNSTRNKFWYEYKKQ